MKYEEIESENKKFIVVENQDGSFTSFPCDSENPEYLAFLEALEGKEPNLPEVIETPETSEAE
jgi:hypothetical protein